MQRTRKRVGVWCATHLLRNVVMRWMCVCAKAAMLMRSAITMRTWAALMEAYALLRITWLLRVRQRHACGGAYANFSARAYGKSSARASRQCSAPHTDVARHIRIQPFQCTRTRPMQHTRNGNAALQAHRHGLAHARTGSSAHAHLCGLAHAHAANTALQARLTMLSAWVAHVTVYRHDLPCAKGSGATRRDRRQ